MFRILNDGENEEFEGQFPVVFDQAGTPSLFDDNDSDEVNEVAIDNDTTLSYADREAIAEGFRIDAEIEAEQAEERRQAA